MSFTEAMFDAFIWYAVLTAFGLATYPLVLLTTTYLPDRGISLYRAIGLALIPLPHWIIGNLIGVPFTWWAIGLSIMAFAGPGWIVVSQRADLRRLLVERRKPIVSFEVVTAVLFFGYVIFRAYNPDISGTEKPMELAFLNAAISGEGIPVQDPWFAGESINYYYFGYVALAAISILSGIPGEVAFNLGLATAFSLATVAAAGIAANLSQLISPQARLHPLASASIAGFFVAVAGNMHAAVQLLTNWEETIRAGWWDGPGWSSSRVIEDTGFADGSVRTVITEFPSFSWVLGDLHPHVIAYPWMITTFGLIANLYLTTALPDPPSRRAIVTAAGAVGIGGGILYSSNTWDVAIVAIFAVLAIVPLVISTDWTRITTALASGFGGFLLSAGAFMSRYDPPVAPTTSGVSGSISEVLGFADVISSMGYVAWDRSSFHELLTHWGGLLLLLLPVVAAILLCQYEVVRSRIRLIAALSSVMLLTSILLDSPAQVLFGLPALILLISLTQRDVEDQLTNAPKVAIAGALLVLCLIEFFFLRDPFGDRMNTVFKFSFQSWAILATAIAALLPSILSSVRRKVLLITMPVVALSILLSLAYVPLSGYRWTAGFQQFHGLDGIEYIESRNPAERAAIAWLSDNADGQDVVLEAPGCAYGSDSFMPHNRVSISTGYATIFGWDGHQRQWRRGQPDHLAEVEPRLHAVAMIYESPEESARLIEEYGVAYVVVGVHEQTGYQQCAIGPPYAIPDNEVFVELGWEPVFSEGETTIFRIPTNEPVD